jgi:hypothetical protein
MRQALWLALAAVCCAFASAPTARAGEQCGIPTRFGPGCRVFVEDRPSVSQQESNVTCWAASISNLLKFHDLDLSEQQIVEEITGRPVLGTPQTLAAVFVHDFTDEGGTSFRMRARVTDNFWGTQHQISNADIYRALRAGQPVFYANSHHAMVLVDAIFVDSPAGLQGIDGIVADPAIGDYRRLSLEDLAAMYVAVIRIEKQ